MPSEVCPRDGSAFTVERLHGIEVERCATCKGLWLEANELDQLEATKASEEERRGTIEYSPRASDLKCPACGAPMIEFEYRAYNLMLNECEQQHGYWLDAGEDKRVLEIIQSRVRELRRVPAAEAAWRDLRRGGRGGLIGSLRRFFLGR